MGIGFLAQYFFSEQVSGRFIAQLSEGVFFKGKSFEQTQVFQRKQGDIAFSAIVGF